MNKELIERIYNQLTAKIDKHYQCVPSIAISAALEIIDDSSKFGVVLLPNKATETIDRANLKWQAKRKLQEIHETRKRSYYDIDLALSDLGEVLSTLGVAVIDTRKKYE